MPDAQFDLGIMESVGWTMGNEIERGIPFGDEQATPLF
jgi:hypothetical protein